MDEWDIQEEYQEPDNAPAGLALKPAIPGLYMKVTLTVDRWSKS
jgi:hypothetical protein